MGRNTEWGMRFRLRKDLALAGKAKAGQIGGWKDTPRGEIEYAKTWRLSILTGTESPGQPAAQDEG